MSWKSANILFADVKGYSSLTDKQMKIFLEKVLHRASNSISHLSIHERNTWGDGIVVISERISDVCEGALALRDTFRAINWKEIELPKLDIRISIHHGEYQEGVDPFTGRPNFVGRTVVTAARIEPVTPPGRIWMTEAAMVMLKEYVMREDSDYFGIDDIGKIELPKKYGSISIFGLRRASEAPLSIEELKQIRDAEQLRLTTAGSSDRDQDLAELISSSKINSFHIVVGVVCHKDKVLLVKRHPNKEGLSWMFPSGKRWPTEDDIYVIEKEILEETGIEGAVVGKIAETQKHPLTGFHCVYFHVAPGEDLDIVNGDPVENEAVEWVSTTDAIGRLGAYAHPDVIAFLRATQNHAVSNN